MTRWPFRLLLLLSVVVILVPGVISVRDSQNRTIITVGYLTAITGELKDKQGLAISGALTMALDEINNDTNLLPGVVLELRWNDTKGDTVLATKAITQMICDGVAVIFGPEGPCYVEAIVTQSRNIPMISYKCSENRASPIRTFARTEPPDTQVIKSVISLLRYYGWKKFSILHDEVWTTVADLLKQEAIKFNMTINHKESFIDNMPKCCELMLPCCRTGFWYQVVQNTMNGTRIYVFLGTASALVDFMASMDTANLFAKGEYMVIFVDMMTYTPKEAEKYLRKPDQVEHMKTCDESENFSQRARSLLVVASTPPTDSYENFTAKVRQYNLQDPFNFVLPSLFHSNNFIKFVSIYAAYLYDSVRLYAWALDKLLREKKSKLNDNEVHDVASDGIEIVETIISNRTYKSVTGATINIDSNGDSEGNFSVLAYKPFKYSYRENLSCNFHMVPVAHFQQGRDIPEYKLINGSIRVDWPSGGDRPFDEPMCGFANELCKKDDRHITSLVAAGILGLLLFCAGVVTMSIYRKWKIELEIEGLLWKIDINEIKGYSGNDIVSSPSKLSLISAQSFGSRCSNQVFTSTARLRGAVVRIKELRFLRKKDMSREIMKEMRLLRELRHDNVNSFIGACVEPTRILLVTDYCAKGSLYDIIENEDIKLDDLFIASLIHDLIKGMIYIHDSSLVYHGNLKSSNCVVTSRWMLQVADFGLHDLRYCAESESIGEHQHYRNQFWKAPELLRNSHIYGSQKGDVYAFAIIMYEIFSRKGPFGQTMFEPKQIVDLVKKKPIKGDAPFRPELECIIEGELCPDYVLSCITDCWHEDPEVRPDFPTIRNRLKKMRGGKTKNIMDQMMEMMEKYANNLEDIVNERTRLLCEEKRKTEDLLHRMLPQSVAEKLTMGLGVEPVSYDLVTIYFSDIVGFTAMSAESTPLQVVNFLNDLYTVFDRIIRGYDVYKVETIGDAYMVVSGLPIKNGNRHAGEIASMALELLQAVKQHRIAHRPNETLRLRIGIHTGPVVAGVVGLTMPRYCLFGDTVNTASRMESTGEALKIHISSKCKDALDKLEGYITEKRGVVHMKGKGEVITYWLIGATEKAIQKKPVDMTDLPPPLFCRPRRSPKLNSDSRQPSIIGMPYGANGSRRQSSVPKADLESNYSLQGSTYQMQRDSPRLPPKCYERLATNGFGSFQGNSIPERISYYGSVGIGVAGKVLDVAQLSHNTLEHSEMNCDSNSVGINYSVGVIAISNDFSQKPLAMVRPHRRINSTALTDEIYGSGVICDNTVFAAHNLREALSLDPIPFHLRRRHESVKLPPSKLKKNNSRSLDTGVALISANPNGEIDNASGLPIRQHREAKAGVASDIATTEQLGNEDIGLLIACDNGDINLQNSATIVPVGPSLLNRRRSGGGFLGSPTPLLTTLPYKHLNNNCNGDLTIEEDVQSPLLQRQPYPSSVSASMDRLKRWHSLENIEHHTGNSVSYADDIDGTQASSSVIPKITKKSARNVSDEGNSSSLFNRLVSIFHGNGKRTSEASLRRVGILPSAVRRVPGFSDMGGTNRDRESIV
ncbi:receptor-type guanylate cyclase Gyc76C-like isoform X1 [Glossina fuscipes]|uniref:Guanylate cyclase n=2 Tax=Glossina fuscipes TaxID=7396 RepID=A0A9C5Z5U5_9MUSC|nr:receptor-type guanylate cyclase Gyc76C-like isoform X1 [Glossina fuscipes]XP_037890391.1 receptor-type guanylate cyclase Gyc76C-like isoform X1 [Glossina fuscipes]XP_037890392.1 receptor-type guanylate cyclase Gyc76C-like isoform X1 [Glossina fuscipes]XP_037890393.1 receptor-type guanylate cyclase Gyc76C-like isoform X1 [Glossina fuscipes]XP_037890394.1 receptor-type guanylate cyclase Gyc76C-like isoform X1 [Glossina fuscipes]XP_037890395.1 receptor-type guanylate cyclase Gyc76C-like isofor